MNLDRDTRYVLWDIIYSKDDLKKVIERYKFNNPEKYCNNDED
jgi:hypothetical protein